MGARKPLYNDGATRPETRSDLHRWIRERLPLSPAQEQALLAAIDDVLSQHERLWQRSKEDALQALAAGFAERLNRLRDELTARDAAVSSISKYFEELVADLTDRVHRDPKTRLMNFRRFVERLEAFLALEQRVQYCAVGLVDITSFKWYNDTLGHAVGDQIIDRVARLLREQIRSADLIAQDALPVRASQELHARFGGDEFCFLIPDLDRPGAGRAIAERFRDAVERHDWSALDARLARKPVHVDVGVVCLALGPVHGRRPFARQLAHDLLARADALMYEAKTSGVRVRSGEVHVVHGTLQDAAPPAPSA